MKLEYVYIRGFGKLRELRLSFADDINVIYGQNETGKSTLHAFLLSMFFGFSEHPKRMGREDDYERYRNWDEPSVYGGELGINYSGSSYRIVRDFNKGRQDISIYDSFGSSVSEPEAFLSRALLSLTETAYKSTVSIGQLAASTGREMASELRRYITNIGTSGSLELSADSAIDYLKAEKERLSSRLDESAVREYASVLGRIKNTEAELNLPQNENKLKDYYELRDETRLYMQDLETEFSDLRLKGETARVDLNEQGFSDRRSIDAEEKRLKDLYFGYVKAEKKAHRISGVVAPILCVLAALFAGFAIYYFDSDSSYLIMELLGGVGVFALLFVFFLIVHIRDKRTAKKLRQELGFGLKEQLSSEEISESAMDKLHEHMEHLRSLYETEQQSLNEEKNVSDRIIELSRRQSDNHDDIMRQEDINRGVEEKLVLLNSLKNRIVELRLVIAENKRLKENIDAIDLAVENISELSTKVKNSIGVYINEEAGRILSGVTGGIYKRLDVSDNMEVYVNTDKRSIPLYKLSMGTMDQVYLSLRLAAIELVKKNAVSKPGKSDTALLKADDELPILFDDSFILYDDNRLCSAVDFIADNYKGQLLIFTCQHREEEALGALDKKFSLIKL